MERFELENSKEFKAAQELEDALNNMSWNSEKFAESVGYYHRTLQQKLFSTMVKVIELSLIHISRQLLFLPADTSSLPADGYHR